MPPCWFLPFAPRPFGQCRVGVQWRRAASLGWRHWHLPRAPGKLRANPKLSAVRGKMKMTPSEVGHKTKFRDQEERALWQLGRSWTRGRW